MNDLHRRMIDEVCCNFKCGINDILSRRRQRNIVYAKKIIYWVLRKDGLTFNQIARMVDKDHETIINGINTIRDEHRVYASKIFTKYRRKAKQDEKEQAERIFNDNLEKIIQMLNEGYSHNQIAIKLHKQSYEIIDLIINNIEQRMIPNYKSEKSSVKYFLKKNKKNY